MADQSDVRPERWWVLDPVAHGVGTCGVCGVRQVDTDANVPMLGSRPLCPFCAGQQLTETPMTAEYARWIEEGDPRWWSPWLCNCPYCDAEELIT